MNTKHRCLTVLLAAASMCLGSGAQESNQISYTARRKPLISSTNNYGPITVKPSGNRQVIVKYRSNAKSVIFENEHHGNRIMPRTNSDTAGTNLAEYIVLAPSDSVLTVWAAGEVRIEGFVGDAVLETGGSPIVVNGFTNAHVHVRTVAGPVTVSAVHNSHVYLQAVSGDITYSGFRIRSLKRVR